MRLGIRSDLLALLVEEAVRLTVKSRHGRYGWKVDIEAGVRKRAEQLGVEPDQAWAAIQGMQPAIDAVAAKTRHRQPVRAQVHYE